jgi:hypothetical protein
LFSTPDFDGSKFQSVKKIFKFLAISFLLIVLVVGGCVFLFIPSPKPPQEIKLIKNFNEHRADFEKLRDMLQADTNLTVVASWGVETTKSVVAHIPPEGNFPVERYNEYLALLKNVGGFVASRDEGEHPDPSIVVWGWGWAGDTKHIGICWKDQAPTNQIATLDGYQGRSVYPNRVVVFRHIDQNWYFWVDW